VVCHRLNDEAVDPLEPGLLVVVPIDQGACSVTDRARNSERSYGPWAPSLMLPNACVKFPGAAANSVGGLGDHLHDLDVAETSSKNFPHEGMDPDIRFLCVDA
jgi:hypothetical protein